MNNTTNDAMWNKIIRIASLCMILLPASLVLNLFQVMQGNKLDSKFNELKKQQPVEELFSKQANEKADGISSNRRLGSKSKLIP